MSRARFATEDNIGKDSRGRGRTEDGPTTQKSRSSKISRDEVLKNMSAGKEEDITVDGDVAEVLNRKSRAENRLHTWAAGASADKLKNMLSMLDSDLDGMVQQVVEANLPSSPSGDEEFVDLFVRPEEDEAEEDPLLQEKEEDRPRTPPYKLKPRAEGEEPPPRAGGFLQQKPKQRKTPPVGLPGLAPPQGRSLMKPASTGDLLSTSNAQLDVSFAKARYSAGPLLLTRSWRMMHCPGNSVSISREWARPAGVITSDFSPPSSPGRASSPAKPAKRILVQQQPDCLVRPNPRHSPGNSQQFSQIEGRATGLAIVEAQSPPGSSISSLRPSLVPDSQVRKRPTKGSKAPHTWKRTQCRPENLGTGYGNRMKALAHM